MGLVQKVVRGPVGVPARGVKRIARAATTPLRARQSKRSTRRRRRSGNGN